MLGAALVVISDFRDCRDDRIGGLIDNRRRNNGGDYQSGSKHPHSKGFALKVVEDFQLICLEAVYCLDHSRSRYAFKPGCGTPTILIRHFDQTVFDWILMHVVESRQIRSLISQPRVPEVIPDSTPFSLIPPIQLARGIVV